MRTQELYSEIVKQLEKLDESSSSEARLKCFRQQHKEIDLESYGIKTPEIRKLIKSYRSRFKQLQSLVNSFASEISELKTRIGKVELEIIELKKNARGTSQLSIHSRFTHKSLIIIR